MNPTTHLALSSRSGHDRPSAWRILLPAGLAEVVLLGALGWWAPADAHGLGTLLFFASFAVYAWAATQVKDAVGGAAVVWGVAILLRLVMLPLAPEFSGEVYRYLWDGYVQLEGVNPFRYAPNDAALGHLRTPWHAWIENPEALSPYPPVAQIAFLAVAVAGNSVFQAKLLWLGFDLGTAWVLGRIARLTGRSRRLTQLLWLWSPLLVVEVAWNAHLEPLGLFGMALFVLLARAPAGSGVAAGLSGLVRPVTLLALPAGTRRLGPRFGASALAVLAAAHLPYVATGVSPYRGAFEAARTTRFMDGPFLLFELSLPSAEAARWAALAAVMAVVVWSVAARLRPERALLWTVGAALAVTPVLRPWFALWILPMAALRVSVPWLAFTGLVYVGYWGSGSYRPGGEWTQPGWPRLVLWLPFLILMIREADRYWRTRVPLAPTAPDQRPG